MVKKFFLFVCIFISASFTEAEAQQRLLLNLSSPLKEIYLGQEAFFQVELLDRIGVQDIELAPVELDNVDVFLLKKSVAKSGDSYDSTKLDFSLIAKSVGKIEFPPLCFIVSAPTLLSARDLPENVEFLSSGIIKICTPSFFVNVKSLPEHASPLFAAVEAKLFDGITPKKLSVSVGTPVKRSLVLAAKGTMPAFLPDFTIPEIDGLRIYGGKTERSFPPFDNEIAAALRQTIVFVPQKAGEFRLPEVNVSWLNVKTGQIETLMLPAYMLTVLSSKDTVNKTINDELISKQENISSVSENDFIRKNIILFLSLLSVAVVLVALLIAFVRRYCFRIKLVKAVETACLNGNSEEMAAALLAWARALFQESTFLSLSDIRSLFEGKADDFVHQLQELEMFLYGTGRFAKHLPGAKENLGKDVLSAFIRAERVKIYKQGKRKRALPDLYPDDDYNKTR